MTKLPKRISKKLREEAILVASCEASNPDLAESTRTTADLLGASDEADELAFQAWCAVKDTHLDDTSLWPFPGRQAVSAEAAALLMDGWSPGDPVVLRRKTLRKAL